MHFRLTFIFSTYGLHFLAGSNFAPFQEVKVPVSNSVDFFFQKSVPWILEDLRVIRVKDDIQPLELVSLIIPVLEVAAHDF